MNIWFGFTFFLQSTFRGAGHTCWASRSVSSGGLNYLFRRIIFSIHWYGKWFNPPDNFPKNFQKGLWNCPIPSGSCTFIMISVLNHKYPQKTFEIGHYQNCLSLAKQSQNYLQGETELSFRLIPSKIQSHTKPHTETVRKEVILAKEGISLKDNSVSPRRYEDS